MKSLRSLILPVSLSIAIITACAGGQARNTAVTTPLGAEGFIDYENANVSTLPFLDSPRITEGFIRDLAVPSSTAPQKKYVLRLAVAANNRHPNDRALALLLSKASFLVADMEKSDSEIEKTTGLGMKAAGVAGAQKADPEASYYYALNLGLYTQAKGLFAISRLPEIEKTLKIAGKKAELDMGGPLRVLGMLYFKAPSWPQGIGDLDKALELLSKAADSYPYNPQNRYFYAAALIENGDIEKAATELAAARKTALPELWGSFYATRWLEEIADLEKKAGK